MAEPYDFKRRIGIRELDGRGNLLGAWVWEPGWVEPAVLFVTDLQTNLAVGIIGGSTVSDEFTWAHMLEALAIRANWRTVMREGPFYTDLSPEALLAETEIPERVYVTVSR